MKNEALRKQLDKQGMTQKDLAKSTGLSRTTINAMAAHGSVTKSTILLVSFAMGVEPKKVGYSKLGRVIHARKPKNG